MRPQAQHSDPPGVFGGKADPYVRFHTDPEWAHGVGAQARAQTKVLRRTLSPEWDDDVLVPLGVARMRGLHVHLVVMDWDPAPTHDCCGAATLSLRPPAASGAWTEGTDGSPCAETIELLLEAVTQRMTGGSGSVLQDDLLLVLPALRFDERAARPRL